MENGDAKRNVEADAPSKQRVPRAYRITLKNDTRVKEKERKSSVEKENTEQPTEHAGQSPDNKPVEVATTDPVESVAQRKSRFIKFQTVSEVEAGNAVKDENTKKSKSALRREKRTIKRKAENKEILDNVLSCIVLMDEKLSLHDTDPQKVVDVKVVDGVDSTQASGNEGNNETVISDNSIPSTNAEVTKDTDNKVSSQQDLTKSAPAENVRNTDNTDGNFPKDDTADKDIKNDDEKSATRKKNRRKAKRKKKSNKSTLLEESVSKEGDKDSEIQNSVAKETSIKKDEPDLNNQKAEEKGETKIEKEDEKDLSNKNSTVEGETQIKKSRTRFRPTHFLAFRLSSPDIRKKVESIQANILNINKDLRPSFVDVGNLYATLAVMTLKDDEEKKKAIKAIDLSLDKLDDVYKNSTEKFIEFESLGSFKDQFIFMKMKETESLSLLQSMVSVVKEHLVQQNTLVRKESFSPHATILKLRNRYSLRKKGITKIPGDMYDEQKNDYFGKEEINELLLCSLAGKKEGEFHKVIASIDLKNKKLIIPDEISSVADNTKK